MSSAGVSPCSPGPRPNISSKTWTKLFPNISTPSWRCWRNSAPSRFSGADCAKSGPHSLSPDFSARLIAACVLFRAPSLRQSFPSIFVPGFRLHLIRNEVGRQGMVKQLSRTELYALVWSEPMKTLSARFGISDVALKKTCARAEIPTPERGYWAKKEVGKSTLQEALPARPPGMSHEVVVGGGGNYWHWHLSNEELRGPIPPRPEFVESIEAVRERIAKVIGNVTIPRDIAIWHPAIDRLLKEDDKRHERQAAARYSMSWDNPLFDAPIERRRLRILNTLFLATAKMTGKPTINGRDARSIHLTFYQQHVGIRLDRPRRPSRRGHTGQGTEPS